MKRLACLLALLLFLSESFAQHQAKSWGQIQGTVIDTTQAGVPGLTVTLSAYSDSSLIFSGSTSAKGNFGFNNIPLNSYRLHISGIGFIPIVIDSIMLNQERFDYDLGDLIMRKGETEMEEVIVFAPKPLFEDKEGVLTYNVGTSVAGNSSSAAELLKNMPMVATDPEGKILMKGKAPRILIDDKPTDMNAEQLADLLESLPGSAIEKIELMMNPPPQYASEEGGVINIVTKRGKVGFTGRVNAVYGTRGDGNFNTNLSYRDKRWSVGFVGGIRTTLNTGRNYSLRTTQHSDSTSQLEGFGAFRNQHLRPNFRLTADYELSPQHLFNVVLQSQVTIADNESRNENRNINRFDQLYKLTGRNIENDATTIAPSSSLLYTFKGKNQRQRVRVILGTNYSFLDQLREQVTRQLSLSDKTPITSGTVQRERRDNDNSTFSLRVNYDQPTGWKPLVVSGGFSYVGNKSDQDFNVYTLNSSGEEILIPRRSADFVFDQKVIGYRSGIVLRFPKKWMINTNMTLEQTLAGFEFAVDTIPDTRSRYHSWLPQANLRKEWSRNRTITFAYRKTVRRPGIGEMNPTVEASDTNNIRYGNPDLQPSLADNFDITLGKYKGKSFANASIGFNRVTDIFQQLRTYNEDEGRTETTYKNLAGRNEYEAGIWGGYSFSKVFRMNGSIHYMYSEYLNNENSLVKYRDGGSFTADVNWTVILNPVLQFEGSSRYHSFADPQGRSQGTLSFQLGVQQKLLDKRMTVSVMVIDPFRQQEFITTTYGQNFTLVNERFTRTQNIRFGLAYNLTPAVKGGSSESKTMSKKDVLKQLKQG